VYSGANNTLLNTVLREEWGFQGFVLTDYFGGYGFQNADQEIRNGNDAMLVAYDTETNHVKDKTSATSLNAMRKSSKNIMYTVVNSRAYEGNNANVSLLMWQIAAIIIDVILAAGIIILELRIIKNYKKRLEKEGMTE
jgi:beta-glucosidase